MARAVVGGHGVRGQPAAPPDLTADAPTP